MQWSWCELTFDLLPLLLELFQIPHQFKDQMFSAVNRRFYCKIENALHSHVRGK